MTQLDNAPTAPTPNQGADPSGGAQGSAATPQGQDEEFIRLPRRELDFVNGDWHEMKRLAKQGKEVASTGLLDQARRLSAEYGMSLSDVFEALQSSGTEPEPTPSQGQTPMQGQEPANIFDPDTFRKSLVSEFQGVLDAREAKAAKAREEADAKRQYQEAIQAEYKAAEEFVKKHGIEAPKPGERGPKYRQFKTAFFDNLLEAKEAAIPSYLQDPAQRQSYFNRPATQEMLAAVAEQTRKDLADLGMEMVADFANKQESTAGASLGHGPGASLSHPGGDKMSMDEKMAYALSGIKDDGDPALR